MKNTRICSDLTVFAEVSGVSREQIRLTTNRRRIDMESRMESRHLGGFEWGCRRGGGSPCRCTLGWGNYGEKKERNDWAR